MEMTAAKLKEIGELLYGDRWQSALARDLEVTDRTVRRWAAGKFRVAADVPRKLRKVMAARATLLAAVRRKLPR